MTDKIKAMAAEKKDELREYRRYLHENPEMSFQEKNTSKWIKTHLKAANIPIKENIHGNSVVGVLDTGRPGRTIAFRADFDAVCVQETTGLEFASRNPGVMHACGHDAHTATLMCFAELMSQHRNKLCGRIVFIFQQGEEIMPGGAKQLVEDGALDGVDEVFCFHSSSIFPLGDINTSNGTRIGAIGSFELKVIGRGGHAGVPHKAVNPIYAASEIVIALNQIVPANIDSAENALICVNSFDGKASGNGGAIIPGEVTVGGIVASMKDDIQSRLFDLIENAANGIAAANGCKLESVINHGYPAVVNAEKENGYIKEAAAALGYNLKVVPPSLAGDDFSYYLKKQPAGAYFTVGMGDPKAEVRPAHHSGNFFIDERGMTTALEMFLYIYYKASMQTAEE